MSTASTEGGLRLLIREEISAHEEAKRAKEYQDRQVSIAAMVASGKAVSTLMYDEGCKDPAKLREVQHKVFMDTLASRNG